MLGCTCGRGETGKDADDGEKDKYARDGMRVTQKRGIDRGNKNGCPRLRYVWQLRGCLWRPSASEGRGVVEN